jgi:hypothetical protein
MLASDVFVLRDDVQFVRNHKYPDGRRGVSYQAHTPVKTTDGAQLLGVSVKKGGLTPIRETALAYEQPWIRKHLNIVKNNYNRAAQAKQLIPEIDMLLNQRYATVGDLNIATTCWGLSRILGVEAPGPESLSINHVNDLLQEHRAIRLRYIATGSDRLAINNSDSTTATERIATLCQTFGANEYLAGGTAFHSYMDTSVFEQSGIKLELQDWNCPRYSQQNEKCGFIANLSIIDLLMNVTHGNLLSTLT